MKHLLGLFIGALILSTAFHYDPALGVILLIIGLTYAINDSMN